MQTKKPISQSDFEKVTTHIIVPLTELYGTEITPYMRDALVEDLYGYDADTLKNGMIKLRKTAAGKIYHSAILEACESVIPRNEHNANLRFQESTKEFPNEADKVMRSPIGQTAINEGWASALHTATTRNGKTDWNEIDIQDFREKQQKAIAVANEIKNALKTYETPEERSHYGIEMDKALAQTLWSLWLAGLDREDALAKKFRNAG